MTKLGPWHPLPRALTVNREAFILERCRRKRALELGCANWPFTNDLFNKGELLFQKIKKVSSALAGVNISTEGVDLLQSRGMKNVFAAEASKLPAITRTPRSLPKLITAAQILEILAALKLP